MYRIARLAVGIALLTQWCYTYAQQPVTSLYTIRSQGNNPARQWAGWIPYVYSPKSEGIFGTVSAAPAYTRSFRPERINHALFGDALDATHQSITISGSTVTNRSSRDLLADYFYLPTDFKSIVSFKPRVYNFLVDFGIYLGFDPDCARWYFIAFTPLVHTRWNMHIQEAIVQQGVLPYQPGYFAPSSVVPGLLHNSFTDYITGATVDPLVTTREDQTTTTTAQPLTRARIGSTRLKRTRFADIRLTFGGHVINEDYCHLGIDLRLALPAGNRAEGNFLFEPLVGGNHNWELGAGIKAHYRAWDLPECNQSLDLFLDLGFNHLFAAQQNRTFDLASNGPLSRYMLAQRLGTLRTQPSLSDSSNAGLQFQKEFAPVANLTNVRVDVLSRVQVDLLAMATFTHECWSIDVGYNVWARSKEIIKIRGLDQLDRNQTWALKGDAFMYGAEQATNAIVTLAATQNNATVNTGINALVAVPTDPTQSIATNPGVDNQHTAITANGPVVSLVTAQPIRTSVPPVFIQQQNLAIESSGTRGLSSTLFAHINYTFADCDNTYPYFGMGASAEFAHTKTSVSPTDSSQRLNAALSQWSVWFKGGLAFD